MTPSTPEAAFKRCLPALRTNVDESGSMTICNAVVPEPDILDSLFTTGASAYNYYLMSAWYKFDMVGKACRAHVNSWYDFFMSQRINITAKAPGVSMEALHNGKYRIRPYILVKREQPINNKYWLISGGALSSADGTNPGDSTHWEMTLTSDAGIPADVGWFAVGSILFATTSADGSVSNTAWKVVSATVSVNSVVIVALPQNAGSYWNDGVAYALTAPPAGLTNPVTGIAERGTNNVTAFESFCNQAPGLIADTFDPFFIQETRHTFEWDEQWAEWEKAVSEDNELFANLYRLDKAKHMKQSVADFQERFVNSLMFQKPISGDQNILSYNSLADIDSIIRWSSSDHDGSDTYCVGKRANATGLFEQMVQAKRVVQNQNQPINLLSLFNAYYEMMRIREKNNPAAARLFEICGPASFFPKWNQGMLEYYKLMSGNNLIYYKDISQEQKVSPLGFVYQDYTVLHPAKVTIRWIHDSRHLDDRYAAAQRVATASGNPLDAALGRQLWTNDWSQFKVGVLGSDRVTRTIGDLNIIGQTNATAACTMRAHKRFIEMHGMAYTAWTECPYGDLLLQGFSDEVPVTSEGGPDYSQACNTALG